MKSNAQWVFALSICLSVTGLYAAEGVWLGGSGLWSVGDAWLNAVIPAASGDSAVFTSGGGTVTNDQSALTLAGITLGGQGYTLTGNSVTFDAGGYLRSQGGYHTVQTPLVLSGALEVSSVTNQSLVIDSAITGTGSLTTRLGRVVLNGTNTFSGKTVLATGLLEVASVDGLGDGSGKPVLGPGTLRIRGTSVKTLPGYELASGASRGVSVLDVAGTVEVSGPVTAPSGIAGAMIKAGTGTVVYTYTGYQRLTQNTSAQVADRDIPIDAINGGVSASDGFYGYTIVDGKVIFDVGTATNDFGNALVVGARAAGNPELELRSGTLRPTDTWFSISRGNTNTATFRMLGGRLEASGLIMSFAGGRSLFSSRSYLYQTAGAIVVNGDAYAPESGGGIGYLQFSGGTLTHKGWGEGFDFARSGTAGSQMIVESNAVLSLNSFRVNIGGSLAVRNGGRLNIRHMRDASSGSSTFDNATLGAYPGAAYNDWFHSPGAFTIGPGGLTLDVAESNQYAFLNTAPLTNGVGTAGTIQKTGAGTMAIYNAEMPVTVQNGTLRVLQGHLSYTRPEHTITLADGTALDLALPHAGEAVTVAANGDVSYALGTVFSETLRPDAWKQNNGACIRRDGWFELARARGAVTGSIMNRRPFSVTNAFSVSFAVADLAAGALGNYGDGIAFVVHNDARGINAFSTNSTGYGYAGASLPITNSFAVILDFTNKQLKFGTNGVVAAAYSLAVLPDLTTGKSDKTALTITYDGAANVSCIVSRNGITATPILYGVNLGTLTQTTHPWIGFTAGNSPSRSGAHAVTDVVLSPYPSQAIRNSVGGYGTQSTISGGQNLSVNLAPSLRQSGFSLGKLTYSEDAVLTVNDLGVTPAQPALTLGDESLWKTNGKSFWYGPGEVAITYPTNDYTGTVYSKAQYRVTDSWTIRFDYYIGDRTSNPPADGFSLTLQPISFSETGNQLQGTLPSREVSIGWRYYKDNVKTTQLLISTNKVMTTISTNIAPIDLVQKGKAQMVLTHDRVAKTIQMTVTQTNATYTYTFENIDIAAALGTLDAYVGFTGYVGGLYAENRISNFSMDLQSAAVEIPRGYLCMSEVAGSGTLIKRGSASLGINDGPDNALTNAAIRLESGGLVLRKQQVEPVTEGDDYQLNGRAMFVAGGALQPMPYAGNSAGNVATRQRRKVAGDWTASFTYYVPKKTSPIADAITFFVHNDPRGATALGGQYNGGGLSGISKSVGLNWGLYKDAYSNRVYCVINDVRSTGIPCNPVRVYDTIDEIDMKVRYSATNKTLDLTMVQGSNVFTTAFTDVDIKTTLGSDYGYIGFGGGSGGSYGETCFRDFLFVQDSPTAEASSVPCVKTLELPAGSTNVLTLNTVVPNPSFTLGQVVAGADATVTLQSQTDQGQVIVTNVVADGDLSLAAEEGTTLELAAVSGVRTVTKSGTGTVVYAGGCSSNVTLVAGTLTLNSASLTRDNSLVITSGTTLNLNFSGTMLVHGLIIDGLQQKGGIYSAANAAWITGPGILAVTYPAFSTTVILR